MESVERKKRMKSLSGGKWIDGREEWNDKRNEGGNVGRCEYRKKK